MNLVQRIAPDRRHSPQPGPPPASICRLPAGTGKWNRVEHRWFSFIGQNRRGKPLVRTCEKIGSDISDPIRPDSKCPAGLKVPDEEVAAIRIERDGFHGGWKAGETNGRFPG